jgi:hypothetical protein
MTDRSGFDLIDGIPRCAVDLPYVHYKGDLAAHVLPAWEEAGIEFECYSSGGGGSLWMIGDPSREGEAQEIALRIQLELERHFNDFGPAENELTVPIPGDPKWRERRIGSVRRAGRTLTLTIDDDATITPDDLRRAVDRAECHVRHMLAGLLNAEGVIDLGNR